MTMLRISGLGARSSSTLRIGSRAIQECTVLHRRVSSTKAAANATTARATAARAPVAAATTLQSSQPRNVPPKLSPISVPGRAGTAIQTFFVDTPAGVSEVADRLWARKTGGSDLYLDAEGHRLSRHGRMSLLILYSPSLRQAFVLDVFALKRAVFRTKGSRGFTIKQILQSNDYKKAGFDVRNDADALFHQYGVALQNVEDVQLMENALRPGGPSHGWTRGLAECLKTEWAGSKDAGKNLFCPKSGGSYAVFNQRPLSPEILAYCVGDVYYLPRLREEYWKQLSKKQKRSVKEKSKARVAQSQKDDKPHSTRKKSKSNSPRTDEFGRTAYVQAKHREMEIEFGGLSVDW
ncbi:ribonuclease H-like protein [Apiospora marii]|uniref:Ribonuclease H-like protein n=1 Tax=Apiospora marii TaxID=335849 RepID=A0ABR1RQL3_9PEZI